MMVVHAVSPNKFQQYVKVTPARRAGQGQHRMGVRSFRDEGDKGSFGIKTTKDLWEPVVGRHRAVLDLRPRRVTKYSPYERRGRRGEEVPATIDDCECISRWRGGTGGVEDFRHRRCCVEEASRRGKVPR